MSIKSAFESEGIDYSQVIKPTDSWERPALINKKNVKH